jgi:hypothetical protein
MTLSITRNVLVSASITGTVEVSSGVTPVSANTGSIATSVRNTVDVSAQSGVMTVSARAVGGRVTAYFALPASHIVDGAQAEARISINVSGASAGNYALVSAPASGVARISRLFLVFNSAANVTFRLASAAASSNDLTGPMFIADKGSIVLDKSDSPWFVTTGTKNFSVNVSAGVGIRGAVYWY